MEEQQEGVAQQPRRREGGGTPRGPSGHASDTQRLQDPTLRQPRWPHKSRAEGGTETALIPRGTQLGGEQAVRRTGGPWRGVTLPSALWFYF